MPILKINWILNGLDNVGIDTEKRVWRLPFNSGPNYYGLKEIKPHIHSGNLYYRIFNKRYTKHKLNDLAIKLKKPKEFTIRDKSNSPF